MLKEEITFYTTRCTMFLKRIKDQRIGESVDFTAECAVEPEFTPFKDRLKLSYSPVKIGQSWGKTWDSAWFHLKAKLPGEWKNKELVCEIIFTGEVLVYGRDGIPDWALTSHSVFDTAYEKSLYFPRPDLFKGDNLELWLEASAYGLTGTSGGDGQNLGGLHAEVKKMRVGIFNREAWHLYYDFTVLFDLYNSLPEKDYRRLQLLSALNKAIDIYAYTPENAAGARKVLAPLLARKAMVSAVETTATGHAHIDVAWLWPMKESIRKAARTFASQLRNMENYPEYVFGASQPALYAFVKEHYPELYEKIKKAVKDGRWEVQGGMWVEADCNIINGESIVRQFLHGKNFFMDEFGVEVKSLWLPDVFGYAATLPQIIKKSGCDYFLTQKISWNQFNKFPYHSFTWQGLDGTQVLTHFPPENTYNASCMPSSVRGAQNNCTEADTAPMMMSLFGIGDGGGGPSEQHLEKAKRIANLEGCPRYKMGKALSFFKKLEKYQKELPLWKGELYLEMHRGTLTTQAKTKLNNRLLEQGLPALEFIASILPMEDYPAEELDRIWKKMLTLQFHDIIPGSSIKKVYEDTEKEHAQLIAEVEALTVARLPRLGKPCKNAILAVNSLPCRYKDRIAVPKSWRGYSVISPDDSTSPVQDTPEGPVATVVLPPSAICTLRRGAKASGAVTTGKKRVLENQLIRYTFDEKGNVVSAYDKTAEREIIKQGKAGNAFTLQVDVPNVFDAWDIEVTMDEERQWSPVEHNVSMPVTGPVISSLEISFKIGDSSVRQRAVLRADSKRLDFITEINWHENNKLLRVAFPVDIFADYASFDIQYGILKRPINTNTSWEKAKFQVCGQRFADISEGNYGVALLNNCKYGYRTINGELELALLKAPAFPDPTADRGYHVCTYSLLPHEGSLEHSDTLSEAAALNRLPALLLDYEASAQGPFTLDSESATLEVIKKAEKQDRLVIRVVETLGLRTKCVLNSTINSSELVETDLVEWKQGRKIPFINGKAAFEMKPFEIKTFFV